MTGTARALTSALAILLVALACGGGDSGGPTGPSDPGGNDPPGGDPPGGDPPGGGPQGTIVVLPATITVYEGDSYVFEAVLDEVDASDLTWATSGGTVAGSGPVITYTAPAQAGVHSLTAKSTSGAAPDATATIVVESAVPIGLPGPNGAAVIDQALDAGQLDVSTAALYRAWWAFRDDRLPQQYRGSATGWRGHVPDEVFAPPAGVSANVLAELASYALPPDADGSWYLAAEAAAAVAAGGSATANAPAGAEPSAPAPGAGGDPGTSGGSAPGPEPAVPGPRFRDVVAASGQWRVIWDTRRPGDEMRAQLLVDEMDRVWVRLRDELGVTPSSPRSGGLIYDVYLVPLDWRVGGEVVPEGVGTPVLDGPQCPAQGSHLLVNRNLTGLQLRTAFTHELMHVFQWALPVAEGCANDLWFMEATAVWAETFFYPPLVEPQETRDAFLADFTDYHDLPMHLWSVSNEGEFTGFAAYPFFVYLQQFLGEQQVFGALREARNIYAYQAMNLAIDGGFAYSFGEFALDSFGQEPFVGFLGLLGATETPARNTLPINMPPGAQAATFGPDPGVFLRPASFDVWWMQVGENEPASVRINNPFFGILDGELAEGVRVHLLYRRFEDAAWSWEDITESEGTTFCRLDPNEDYDEFALVLSNGVWHQDTPTSEIPLAEGFSGCFEWRGEAYLTYRIENQLSNVIYLEVDLAATDLVFSPGTDQGAEAPFPVPGVQRFDLKSGSMTAQVEEGSFELDGILAHICKWASGDVIFPLEDMGSGFLDFPGSPEPGDPNYFFGSGEALFTVPMYKLNQDCTREIPGYQIDIEWLRTSPDMQWAESADPNLLEGTYTREQTVFQGVTPYTERWEWTWSFQLFQANGGG